MPGDNKYSVQFEMAFKNQEWRYEFHMTGTSAREIASAFSAPVPGDAKDLFLNALLSFHAGGVELVSVSVRNVITKQRDSRKEAIRRTNTSGHDVVDVTNNSFLSTVFSDAGAQGSKTLSGLPDAMIERNADGTPSWNAMFNARWTDLQLRGLAVGFSIYSQDPGLDSDWRVVRVMEPDTVTVGGQPVEDPDFTKFTTSGNHGFVANDVITFERRIITRETDDLSGDFRIVTVPGATSFTLATGVNFRGDSHQPKYLRVRKPTFSLQTINQWKKVDFGTRQRGEGGGPRGRSSSRKRRPQ